MKKKLVFLAVSFILCMPGVFAKEITAGTDAELTDAFANSITGDVIKLTGNITDHQGGSSSLMVKDGKNITLDLNGHTISASGSNRTIVVNGGNLIITGKGTIKQLDHNAVNVWGSETAVNGVFSKLTVDKDVTLEGSCGLGIFYDVKNAYGVEVDFAGKINATDVGFTINGIITNDNAPIVNIKNGASINVTGENGVALYLAGNGTTIIENGVTMTGAQPIEVRAGKLNVNGGTFTSTAKELSSKPNGNGQTTMGAGIAVVQHTTKLPINVNIKGGTFTGVKSIYVNNTQGNSAEDFAKVIVQATGGTFNTEDITKFVASNYKANKTNGMYNVVENKVIEDNSGKVIFESEKPLDNKYQLKVTEKSKDEKTNIEKKVSKAFETNNKVKDATLISVYDISVSDASNNVVPMENGKFTISIAIAKSMQKYDAYKVVYLDAQGNIKETLNAELVNGNIVFTTTHLSTYAIVGYNNADVSNTTNATTNANTNKTTTNSVKNPSTNDINLPLILLIGLISLSGVVLTTKKVLEK